MKRHRLPDLLVLDELELSGDEADADVGENEAADDDEREERSGTIQRVREEMLGDRHRGISAPELAQLLGLEEGTIRNYLASERRRSLLQRIRKDPRLRSKVLSIVSRRRAEE